MSRLPITLAAATLAVTLGANLAHAQSTPAYNTPAVPPVTGQPTMPPMTSGSTPSAAAPTTPTHRSAAPMRHHNTQRGMSGSSQSSMSGSGMSGSGMSGSGMQGGRSGGMQGSAMSGGPTVPTPAQPFSGLSLPQQQGVGDGAYNGGGVVLEYMPDGTRRVVQQ
jgi:hypothetical protein